MMGKSCDEKGLRWEGFKMGKVYDGEILRMEGFMKTDRLYNREMGGDLFWKWGVKS